MSDLFAALGLVLVLEGIAYAFFPNAMRRLMEAALHEDEAMLRRVGIGAIAIGFTIVWLIRSSA